MTSLALTLRTMSVMFMYTIAMSNTTELQTTLSGAVKMIEGANSDFCINSMTFGGQMASPARERYSTLTSLRYNMEVGRITVSQDPARKIGMAPLQIA